MHFRSIFLGLQRLNHLEDNGDEMPKVVIPPSSTIPSFPPASVDVVYGKPKKTSVYFKDASSGSEKSFSDFLIFWDYIVELNKLKSCKLTLVGLSASDFTTYVKKKNTFKLFSEEHFAGKFKIEEVKRKEDYTIEVKGIGMGITLQEAVTDQSTYNYYSEDTPTIVTEICTEMNINENQDLGNVTGSFSWQDKLSALFTISNYFQADWWVDQVFPFDTDRFNIKQRRGSVPVVRNYYDDGSNRNANITKRINTEFHVNDISLRGKNDADVFPIGHATVTDVVADSIVTSFPIYKSTYKTVRESNFVISTVLCTEEPQWVQLQVYDGNDWHNYRELTVKANRVSSYTLDVRNVSLNGIWMRPLGWRIRLVTHASNTCDVTISFARTIPLRVRMYMVNDYYSKLDADFTVSEGVPFDIACQDSVSFPDKGIVKIGNDSIGYLDNEGNVLANCIADVYAGALEKHRAGIIIYPVYDAEGKADTFLTANVSAGVSTYTVNDTTGFPSSGSIIISDQVIDYTGKTSSSFTGCTNNEPTDWTSIEVPHSQYTRVFEYDSTKHYLPSAPKTGSLVQSESLKSGKYFDSSLDDETTAEVLASAIMEANLDSNVIAEGGLITIDIEVDHPWLEMGKVNLGDTIYVNSISTRANIDGNYRVKKIHWYFNSKYGHRMIIEAGSKKNLFVEKLMSKWKQLAD